MTGKPLDEKTALMLLGGKRNLNPQPRKPDPRNTPAELTYDYPKPEWHKWVYGGQRNPYV